MSNVHNVSSVDIDNSEHIGPDATGDNVSARKTALYSWNSATSQWERASSSMGKLVTEKFDYITVAYPDATTETYTYKSGGSGGVTVATVTVVYTDSTKANLSTVTRT